MRPKKPYVATMDQVTIKRDGDAAVIEYVELNVLSVHLTIGPEIEDMTDREILALHNEGIRGREKLAAEFEYVAVEVPSGSQQIEYHHQGDSWIPKGGVLRCVIDQGEDGETTVWIDQQELNLEEFGKVLSTYAGWGMRIIFVPDDDIFRTPTIEVREPKDL